MNVLVTLKFKLLQELHFHYHLRYCSEIFCDDDDYSIVQEVSIL